MNKEFKRMQQLAGLLTEVRIVDAHADIPRDLKEVLEKLEAKSYFMFESGSPEDDEPVTDRADIDEIYLDEEISEDEYNTVKKYSGKQFVSDVLLHPYDVPNPNKPRSGFNTLIKIYTHNENCYVDAEVPNVDVNGTQLGWFIRNGEYIFSDTGAALNEVRIVANNPLFYRVDYRSYEFNAPNGKILEGYTTDDSNGWFVEIIGNNPLLFGTVIFSEEEEAYPENEEAMKQMEVYLDKHRVLYTSNQVNMEGDDEYYLCVDLDELEIKKLIK
jgi:hypothetical protein